MTDTPTPTGKCKVCGKTTGGASHCSLHIPFRQRGDANAPEPKSTGVPARDPRQNRIKIFISVLIESVGNLSLNLILPLVLFRIFPISDAIMILALYGVFRTIDQILAVYEDLKHIKG